MISHEYGHSLGLPDYYSTGSRETYGAWTLMATDYSQNIDVIGKKELGWLVPRVLEPGAAGRRQLAGHQARHRARSTGSAPDGTPYALLRRRASTTARRTSPTCPGARSSTRRWCRPGTHLWWSGSGNDFGCPPDAGHNLDLALPAVPAGTQKLTLTFKSRWDIEWDFDYGFVLSTAPTTARPTRRIRRPRATRPTAAQNPNANGCQSSYGNGLTGSSGSYAAGSQTVDRLAGNYPAAPFVDDEYDITDLIGKPGAVLRFATPPTRGWRGRAGSWTTS